MRAVAVTFLSLAFMSTIISAVPAPATASAPGKPSIKHPAIKFKHAKRNDACGVHVRQQYGVTEDTEVTIYSPDPEGHEQIGYSDQSMKTLNGSPMTVGTDRGDLLLELVHGDSAYEDDNYDLKFTWGDETWVSTDSSRCSVGGWDGPFSWLPGNRDLDCSFAC